MTYPVRTISVLAALVCLGGCGTAAPALAPSHAASRSIQSSDRPTQVLVKFKLAPTPRAVEAFGSEYGLRPDREITEIDVYVMTIVTGEDAAAIADRVDASPLVDYAEPNYRYRARANS